MAKIVFAREHCTRNWPCIWVCASRRERKLQLIVNGIGWHFLTMLCYESALLMDTKTKKTKRQKYIFLKHKKAKTKKILWCQGSFNVYLLPRYDMMSGMIWYDMYDVRYDIVWYDVREVSMFIFCPGMATALAPSGLRLETLVSATVTGKTWLLQQVKLAI